MKLFITESLQLISLSKVCHLTPTAKPIYQERGHILKETIQNANEVMKTKTNQEMEENILELELLISRKIYLNNTNPGGEIYG